MSQLVIRGPAMEDTALVLLARIRLLDTGALLTQAAVSSITFAVYDESGTLVTSGTLLKAEVIYDTLQRDTRWASQDTLGYNFAHVVDGAAFPAGDTVYTIQHLITPVTGKPLRTKYVLDKTVPVFGS